MAGGRQGQRKGACVRSSCGSWQVGGGTGALHVCVASSLRRSVAPSVGCATASVLEHAGGAGCEAAREQRREQCDGEQHRGWRRRQLRLLKLECCWPGPVGGCCEWRWRGAGAGGAGLLALQARANTCGGRAACWCWCWCQRQQIARTGTEHPGCSALEKSAAPRIKLPAPGPPATRQQFQGPGRPGSESE